MNGIPRGDSIHLTTARSDNGAHEHTFRPLARWTVLVAISLGVFMTVVDSSAVVVALPTMERTFGISDASVMWIVNAYLMSYGGLLLLTGRLGDTYGHRRLFLAGLLGFTLASLGCALPHSVGQVIFARAVQGLAGAIVVTGALPLIVNNFQETRERATAVGAFGFACSAGGIIGVLLGGLLTGLLNWRYIFLINLPLGLAAYGVCWKLLREPGRRDYAVPPNLLGALAVTGSLAMAVFALTSLETGNALEPKTLIECSASLLLFGAFLKTEARSPRPLVARAVLRRRNFVVSCAVRALSAGAGGSAIFISLYIQNILGRDATQVGLSLLPSSLGMAVFALGLSAQLVGRFGIRRCLSVGMICITAGLLLLAQAPANGTIAANVVPAATLIGAGSGVAFGPLLMAAVKGASQSESGVISGLISTSSTLAASIWIAVLSAAVSTVSRHGLLSGNTPTEALVTGYHTAFLIAAFGTLAGAVLASLLQEVPASLAVAGGRGGSC